MEINCLSNLNKFFGNCTFDMKKYEIMRNLIIASILALSFFSCGTSFDHFFKSHKTDLGTTSFEMPNFFRGVLTGLAPETKTIIDHISDFQYIKFDDVNAVERQILAKEMNEITTSGYTDMYRKNEINQVRILSVKEKGNKITDFIIFNSNDKETTAFYLRGNFDPTQIKLLSDETKYSEFTEQLIQAYQNNLKVNSKIQ